MPAEQISSPAVPELPGGLSGRSVHMVGIKGNGMAALAEVLAARGATVTGSDVEEQFQTQQILDRLGVVPQVGFDGPVPEGTDLVVHSTAFQQDNAPQLVAAARAGVPVLTYPQALGSLSRQMPTVSVTGSHGKSTTTALCASLVDALGVPATVLAGTGMANLDGAASLNAGDASFVVETCEYHRHFEWISPSHAVVTSVEWEHPDTYSSLQEVVAAFASFLRGMAQTGHLIYCADDAGATTVAEQVAAARPDLRLVPYGEAAEGPFSLSGLAAAAGETRFRLAGGVAVGVEEIRLSVPAAHNALNAAAAVAVAAALHPPPAGDERRWWQTASRALAEFRGGRRRMELVGEAAGVTVIDDYGHHPTEIVSTLAGLRAFYPGRRLVVDFMSHTYTRTLALLDEFGAAFADADVVLLHPVFASAREQDWLRQRQQTPDEVAGQLMDAVSATHPAASYHPSCADAVSFLLGELREGDLLVTMGAGDNWQVGREVLRRLGGDSA